MSKVDSEEFLDLSDLSDKEDAEKPDLSPFLIDWFDVNINDSDKKVGISSLPGSKFKKSWRSIPFDIKCMKDSGIEDIFCLCTKGEFYFYRVPDLLEDYKEAGFTVHHHPIEDSMAPSTDIIIKILEEIKACLTANKKILIHSYGGLGRSCCVALCLSLFMDDKLSVEEGRDKLKQLRGERAAGSIKQYNFCNEFRAMLETYKKGKSADDRCASR